ncbi:MAG: tRNA (adenosine(37)-N6)-threonylcarbamoyltransferase complex dimerization subunit type 1 TsaB [Pseudomonadota bacterium]
MHLLAFELSTEACSVAVWSDGTVRERHEIAPRRHAELALPWAEALLAEAGIAKSQLDAIAVGRGPGAFTGVRLGISIAQGIALALDRPAVPVSTLSALALRATALGAGAGDRVFAAIDARMREVYVAGFAFSDDADGAPLPRALDDERVAPPETVSLPDDIGGWYGVGTGFAAQEGALRIRLAPALRAVDAGALPHAADVARLAAAAFRRGEAIPPERLEPAYLRNQVALTLVEQQALRAARDA